MRCTFLSAIVFVWLSGISVAAEPSLPLAIDTTFELPTTGNTTVVNTGGDFQAAINNAALGDVIVLEAGATFTGQFTLPNKAGSGWIYIVSSGYESLPQPGERVSASDAINMAKIRTSSGYAISTQSNANNYRFVGIDIAPSSGSFIYTLVRIGAADVSETTLPENIVFDRCYIHGDPVQGGQRGVAMDGKGVAVIDSHISGFIVSGFDTQALWAYNTPGPIKIVNNYIEAGGENVMFGGADAKIANCVPSDIEIRRNHFFKPLEWKSRSGVVKNLFELKNARRVLVEGNVFENNWTDSQAGSGILFTVRNQDGGAPWSTVEDVTFRFNKIINSEQGINILARDDTNVSGTLSRVVIHDNLLDGVDGRTFQLYKGSVDLQIYHNTATSTLGSSMFMSGSSPKNSGFVFRDNIVHRKEYGFFGDAVGEGNAALGTFYESGWIFDKNIVVSAPSSSYPPGNYFPSTFSSVKFVDASSGDYTLASDSPYKNAGTNSTDIGADITAVDAATDGVVAGTPAPDPDPTPETSIPGSTLSIGGMLLRVGDDKVLRIGE